MYLRVGNYWGHDSYGEDRLDVSRVINACTVLKLINRCRHEPNMRGTFRLLLSCLLTLSLCIHTALHLNIRNTSKLGVIVKKLKWVLVGMFAPEYVVYIAWRQWMSARQLQKVVNTHLMKQVYPSNYIPQRRAKVTRITTIAGRINGHLPMLSMVKWEGLS